MIRKVVAVLLVLLLIVSVLYFLFLYQQNVKLSNENSSLKNEIIVLKSANLTTALGIVEIPPYFSDQYYSSNLWWANNFSYVWITGWVFNSGAGMANNSGLNVLAFDEGNSVLMNYTVPIVGYGVFSVNENRTLIPSYVQLTPLEFGNVLSQQNVTVRLSIFHEGLFPNSTRYQINPLWNHTI